jgi:hypothetical protein
MPEPPEKDRGVSDNVKSRRIPTRFAARLTLPAQSKTKSKGRKDESPAETTRIVSEAKLREEAAWKQVEETGKPVQFEDQLLMPEGMSFWEAIESLPDGVREQVRSAMQKTVGDAYLGLVRRERDRILEMGVEDSQFAAYRTFPHAAQLALADSIVRQRLEFPEIPLIELIELYGGEFADASADERSE